MSSQRLIVMKFGGTSVGDAARFRQCAEIIARGASLDRVIVVVSAMAGVTDLIFKTMDAARHGDSAATEAHVKKFESIHRELITDLLDETRARAALDFAGAIVDQLRNSSQALLALRSEISPQTKDSLAALGEKISAWVLASYMEQTGKHGHFVRAEDAIVTDGTFGNALPDMEATAAHCKAALLPVLESGGVPVVAGYSGATRDGHTTTLGRGGTDYSATILGAATRADEVWIWTDVDGVLTADPRICPDATILPEISFDEAIELAYYGAKVIHPKAAYPAADAGIPIWIKNSFRPEVPGTKITQKASPANSAVKAVTCVNHATLMALVTRRDVNPAELWGRLFLRLGQEQTEVLFATQSSPEHALGLVLRKEDSARVLKLIHSIFRTELAQGVLTPVAVHNDIAVVAVLGESMKGQCGILGRLFSSVARCQVSVIAVAQGASELSICFAVASASAAEVVRAVHSEFCGTADVSVCVRPNAALVVGAR
ncbi:MAG TPA: aspartate kinase [Verrucomicrobiae bacterium]|jgi:aspartokinase/homoserine dehydrogenase 1|nr:aspartate kinase [Verrucomicrobiae bacterium]